MSYIAVIPTNIWLNEFNSAKVEALNHLQHTLLGNRLLDIFPNGLPEEIILALQQQGLFQAQEELTIQNGYWQVVQREFEILQKRWAGPDIPIYLFPITQEQKVTNKNGVSYPNALFLFIGEIEEQELQALFAHEYNHVCRLSYLGKSLADMTLLDAVILEGLAEYAVEELYSKQWQAEWLNTYSSKEMLEMWQQYFYPQLEQQGIDHHVEFLYGGGKLPPWIGYCIGYQIVKTYVMHHNAHDVYQQSSAAILAGSDFR
ncbi:DUF2268 domain-containing protein [Lysinibacillus piscis]|uniref:DUF2268 domain-containing protein n=1 Tax=Lysinibacillus piscis TaxID=2518931 RepID=A0ABQ5NME3_9BACI|nr:DUF2268 domain-containing protein [Lysinibacillus sp. KH24]GLC89531.1 hypothetical protein LYSBPC_26580 [Lysinibacillus sp. KH24]